MPGSVPERSSSVYVFFFGGTFPPALRASLNAMATACFRLVTFWPLLDLRVPSFFSFITL